MDHEFALSAAHEAIRKDGNVARAFWKALMSQDLLTLEGIFAMEGDSIFKLRDEKTDKNPVEWCVFLHRHDSLRSLLVHGADVEEYSATHSLTPLRQACGDHCLECVEILLEAGADVDAEGDDGFTPLVTTANSIFEKKSAVIAKKLLEAGANPNIVTQRGYFALGAAASCDKVSDVSVLLDGHAEIDLDAGDGFSALFYAVSNGAVKTAEELLRRGADFNRKADCDGDDLTPLDLARQHNDSCLAALLYSFSEAEALRERIGKIAPSSLKNIGHKTARL